jgi:Zn-dependent protease
VSDQLLASIIVVAIMLLIGFPVHEFSHALAAYRLGDSTARFMGRLSLNPIVHFDPLGGILLALTFIASQGSFGFGWAKPTPVNPRNLEGGRYGEAIVAAAGPISNLVLAIAAAIPLRYIVATPSIQEQIPFLLIYILLIFVNINIVLMVFNLFPIPPLDGSKVLFSFLPPQVAWRWRPVLEQYGFVVLLLLFFVPPGDSIGARILIPIIDAIRGFLVGF